MHSTGGAGCEGRGTVVSLGGRTYNSHASKTELHVGKTGRGQRQGPAEGLGGRSRGVRGSDGLHVWPAGSDTVAGAGAVHHRQRRAETSYYRGGRPAQHLLTPPSGPTRHSTKTHRHRRPQTNRHRNR